MENDEYMYAEYTMTFNDFVEENKDWFEKTMIMSTQERTASLQLALLSRWRMYEVSGETVQQCKVMFEDVLNEFKPYYEDMITNYDKEFDYASAVSHKTTNETIHVELPNKKIDPNDIYSYPTSGDKATIEYEDKSRFLMLKAQYLNQIQDLYREFANRFRDCFIHLF